MKEKTARAAIQNEANNGLKNTRGTIAMARKPDPHSATAQFFINVVDNDFLDFKSESPQGWGYCVFGKIVEGMEVVDKIREARTGNVGPYQNVPNPPVIIKTARVLATKK
jgi:cyclophilin family peptidyl-prolyl cis-trans isomerase